MLIFRNTASVSIENAAFNGANSVRAIEISDSALQLINCTFERCYHEKCVGAVYILLAVNDLLLVAVCLKIVRLSEKVEHYILQDPLQIICKEEDCLNVCRRIRKENSSSLSCMSCEIRYFRHEWRHIYL